MSKFLSEKKRLLEEVYEKASCETTEKSFSGILKSLEASLWDDFKIKLSYKTFETYYNNIVLEDGDYNIKSRILDELSVYIGYNNFLEYRSEWNTVEHTIQQAISKIVITVINKPLLAMPEFVKQNGFGIAGLILVISVLIANSELFNAKAKNSIIATPSLLFGFTEEKKCMYWDDSEYKLADCESKHPYHNLRPIDTVLFNQFKRITRKDTLTVQNAYGKTWYSKYNGEVAFFTMDGKDPDNGRELRSSTPYIIYKYGGKQEDSIVVEE